MNIITKFGGLIIASIGVQLALNGISIFFSRVPEIILNKICSFNEPEKSVNDGRKVLSELLENREQFMSDCRY